MPEYSADSAAAAPAKAGGDWVHLEIAFSPEPRQVQLQQLRLPAAACTVQDALRACGLSALQDMLQSPKGMGALSLGVAGVAVQPATVLSDGDRLDCCRALRVDPKLARRERFNQQGVRRSGLFAKRRPGAVAGY